MSYRNSNSGSIQDGNDVALNNLANNDALLYDASVAKWRNGPTAAPISTTYPALASTLAAHPNAPSINVTDVDYNVDSTNQRQTVSWVVPDSLAADATGVALRDGVAAIATARAANVITRTGQAPTSTDVGLPTRSSGLGMTVQFPDSEAWTVAAASSTNYNYTAIVSKRPALPLNGTIRSYEGEGSARITVTGQTGGGVIIGSNYRPYDETMMGADGSIGSPISISTTSGSDGVTWDYSTIFSGGRGDGGRRPWRFLNTGRANITADVSATTTTFPVDNVDGIDHAFFSSAGKPIPANVITVGNYIWVQLGQNDVDAHETFRSYIAVVKAINGNATAGYTTSGSGTITVSEAAGIDVPMSSIHWSFPDRTANTYRFLASGPINTPNFSLTAIDPAMLVVNPVVKNLNIICSDRTTTGVALQGCEAGTIENVRCYNPQGAAFSFAEHRGGRMVNCWLDGSDSSLTNAAGMWLNVCTAEASVSGGGAIGFGAAVAQVETGGRLTTRDMQIINSNSGRDNTTPLFVSNGKSVSTHIDTIIRGNPTPLASVVGNASVMFDGNLDIKVDGPFNLYVGYIAPTCRPRLRGYSPDGSTAIDWQGKAAEVMHMAIPLIPGRTSSTPITRQLPPGLIRSINAQVIGSAGGSLTGVSDVLIKTTTPTGGPAVGTLSLAGFKIGDPVGSNGTTTVTSATVASLSRDVGSTFTWPDQNFATIITAVGGGSGAYTWTLSDPLPADLSATSAPNGVRYGGFIIAGGQVAVAPTAFGRLAAQNGTTGVNWNSWKITPGSATQLQVITDTTAPGTETLLLEIEYWPPAELANGYAANVNTDLPKPQVIDDSLPAPLDLNYKGIWAPNTYYPAGSIVDSRRLRWARTTAGVSGSTFSTTNWLLLTKTNVTAPTSGKVLLPEYITAIAASTLVSGNLVVTPLMVPAEGLSVSALTINQTIQESGGSGTTLRLGIWNDDGTGYGVDWPSGPLLAPVTIDLTTAVGNKTAAYAITLPPGMVQVVSMYLETATVPTTKAQVSCISGARAGAIPVNATWSAVFRYMVSAGQTTYPTNSGPNLVGASSGTGIVVGVVIT